MAIVSVFAFLKRITQSEIRSPNPRYGARRAVSGHHRRLRIESMEERRLLTSFVPAECLAESGGWSSPTICRLSDGHLLLLYDNDNNLDARLSSSGGIAWSSERTIVDSTSLGASNGVFPYGVSVLRGTNTILALFYTPYATAAGSPYADVNGQADVLYSITGTYTPASQSVRWAAPVPFIAGPADGFPTGNFRDVNAGLCAPLELSDGSILYPVYRPDSNAAGASLDVWRATASNGNWNSPAWAQYSTIVAQDPNANETCLVQTGNQLAALVRYDDAAADISSIKIWTSADNGQTWTTNGAEYLTTGYNSISAPSAIVMPSGLICLSTGVGAQGERQAAVYFSNDLQNWRGPVVLPGSYGGYGQGTAISGTEMLVAQNTGAVEVTLATFFDPTFTATVTWSGNGADARWSTAANWGGGAAAANDELYFGGSSGLSNTNDLAADTPIDGVTFNAGAGPFALGGNALNLAGDITNDSTTTQTINLSLVLSGSSRMLSAAAGNLNVGGDVGESGGSYGTIISGPGSVTLSGTNSYSGGTLVSSGTLIVGSPSALPDGSSLTVGDSAASLFGPANS
jgi:autotransporter-associated beta strand protein